MNGLLKLCPFCNARIPYCHSEEEAIRQWNGRALAPLSVSSGEVETSRTLSFAMVSGVLCRWWGRDVPPGVVLIDTVVVAHLQLGKSAPKAEAKKENHV